MSDRETGPGTDTGAGTGDDTSSEDARPPATGSDDENDAVDAEDGPMAGNGSGATADESGGRFGTNAPVNYLTWAAVVVLAITALVALFGFYTGVSRVISVWVSRPYRPVVNAAFNLALLLAALGGIGLLLRGRD